MEFDFSAQITAKNLNLVSKPLEFDGFKLSDKALAMLESKASKSGQNVETLKIICENGTEAAKNFFRPTIHDFHVVIARLNKFLNRGEAKLLTPAQVELSDMDFALARVTAAEFKLSDSDFREIKAEMEKQCECEDETEEEEVEGAKVCARCKKGKAKKNC